MLPCGAVVMGDVDVRHVCKICYVSSSHKPNPTLTPENKAAYAENGPKCSVCRQGWAPIRVARDGGPSGGRWVRIRPRPKISAITEFQMCKNMQGGRVDCPRGLDCSYAHSRVELSLWNAERRQEPRPAPPITGPHQYQLCKHMQSAGNCPYGLRCTFAHSEEEYHEWLRNIPASPAGGLPAGGIPPSSSATVGSFRCDICCLTCTSKRQLDDHFSGSKHRERFLQLQSGPPQTGPNISPGPSANFLPSVGRLDMSGVRKKPSLSFQIMGFKMCMHVQANRRCIYGDFCTFAHSTEELQAWNRQLSRPAFHPSHHTVPQNIVRYQAPPPPPQHGG